MVFHRCISGVPVSCKLHSDVQPNTFPEGRVSTLLVTVKEAPANVILVTFEGFIVSLKVTITAPCVAGSKTTSLTFHVTEYDEFGKTDCMAFDFLKKVNSIPLPVF